MGRLGSYARRQGRRWAWGGLLLLLTNACAMAVPQLFRRAVDAIHHGAPIGELRQLALLLVALAGAGMLFRTLSRVHILFAARDVELELRCDMFGTLTALPPAFYAEHATGDLMSRAVNDLTQIRLMLGPGLLNIVNTAVAYAVALPLMVAISAKLTAIAFAVYPPAIALMRVNGRRLYARNRAQQAALGALSAGVQENLAGAQFVRAFVREDEEVAAFARLNDATLAANLDLVWTRSTMFRISASLGSVGALALVGVGALEVLAGRLTAGDLVGLVEYMALLSGPTFALGWVLSLWQRGAASMARIEEVMGAPGQEAGSGGHAASGARQASGERGVSAEREALPERGALLEQQVVPGVRALPEPQLLAQLRPLLTQLRPLHPAPVLSLRDLSIQLDTHPALQQLTLEIAPGTTVGIVGAIGAGKSTLLRALLRLVEVPPGAAFVDGVDIAGMPLAVLRRQFGYVPQAATLLSRSLAANIAFGRPEADATAIAAAVHAAALTPDVAALPRGLDTEVGERGVSLSGGQKQRAALARALLVAPPVLLLDDALSAVDSATEEAILARLAAARGQGTTLIVAHRVSAVRAAEQIVVLAAGRMCERGTHAELLAHGGIYADMVRRQALAAAS